MNNQTQILRYKKLLDYLDRNFKEDINIEKIEAACHYSYRNINRIFEALHHETIGQYIKRLRLEKAAQYLKYSAVGIADIAYEVGFKDRSAFSKAFRKKYGCAPSAFRSSSESSLEVAQQSLITEASTDRERLQFEPEYLPDFDYLFLEFRGDYTDTSALEKASEQLYKNAKDKGVLTDRSIFMTEIMDDSEISDSIHLRYNMGFILDRPLPTEPEGLFRIKKHKQQKYAKFVHEGNHQSCIRFYNKIYAFWMLDIGLELKDSPTIEFYPNYDKTPDDDMLTEIYIPVF
ncbi:MAG: AraC family transcriptional regulator [Bacteroidota bacterium]